MADLRPDVFLSQLGERPVAVDETRPGKITESRDMVAVKVRNEDGLNRLRINAIRSQDRGRSAAVGQGGRRQPAVEALGKRPRGGEEVLAVAGVDQGRAVHRVLEVDEDRVELVEAPFGTAGEAGKLAAVAAVEELDARQ